MEGDTWYFECKCAGLEALLQHDPLLSRIQVMKDDRCSLDDCRLPRKMQL